MLFSYLGKTTIWSSLNWENKDHPSKILSNNQSQSEFALFSNILDHPPDGHCDHSATLGCWRRNNTSVIWSWLIGASWILACSEIYHFCLSRCFLPRTGQCREINLSFKCNELETAQHNGLLIANEVHIKKRFISQHYLNDSLKLLMILYCVLCDPLKFLAVRTNHYSCYVHLD